MSIVNTTLAKIKDKVSPESYAQYEATGKTCQFADVTAWKNNILAEFAANVLQFSEQTNQDIIRMEMPRAQETKSLWDRL
jgi:hypothetical protein